MGMYTELVCAFSLPEETPKDVIKILEYMASDKSEGLNVPVPNHPLFESARWHWMLQSDSYYFEGDTNSTVRHDQFGDYYVTIRCNLKNYDNEISKFIDWIKPYTRYKGFIGYSRYEEAEHPTLIYI